MALSLLSVMHVNVNCSDLGRSLAFYRDRLGLMPLSHTRPVPQDGRGFGLEGQVQWDAQLLHDSRGHGGPAVDLLEWKQPAPVGAPPAEANHLGFFRLCFAHPDIAVLYTELEAAGVPLLAPPASVPIDPGSGLAVRFFCARDPDGTTVEFIELPGEPRLLHVNVNCRDLERSAAFYRDVLGLESVGGSAPGPVDGASFGFAVPAEWHAEFLAVPGQADRFVVDLLEWKQPTPVGRPAQQANQLGMFRMAFLVEDARACHEALVREGVDTGPPVWLDMGPDIPIDGLWAVFFRDPDGTCLELIQTPELG
jgi:catechol 2,3-dioxygenase-like lactoylglutathione lyase family enzyme